MLEALVYLIGVPLIATIISRTEIGPDVIDPIITAVTPRAESPRSESDPCATVRQYGYMGNVDVKRIGGDPCGLFERKQPESIAATPQK